MTGSLSLSFLPLPDPRGAVILSERAERAGAKDLFRGGGGLRPPTTARSFEP
jgi:hypothetical protein